MEEYAQSIPNLVQMSQNLFDLIKFKNILMYPDKELRRHALAAIAVERDRGWKISKKQATQKIDLIVALAMSCIGLVKTRVQDSRPPQKIHYSLQGGIWVEEDKRHPILQVERF